MTKLILNFKSKDSKKIKNPKNYLGGKGANLAEMRRLGLPVPPGFTVSTKACDIFYKIPIILRSIFFHIPSIYFIDQCTANGCYASQSYQFERIFSTEFLHNQIYRHPSE